MLWAKIYNNAGEFILIGHYGKTSALKPIQGQGAGALLNLQAVVRAEENRALAIYRGADLFFTWSKTDEIIPNMGSLVIEGLDQDAQESIKIHADFDIRMSETADHLPYSFEFLTEAERKDLPVLAGTDVGASVEDDQFYRNFIKYGFVEVFWGEDRLYKGDVVEMTGGLDTLTIELGTHHWFYKSPVLARLWEQAVEAESFVRMIRGGALVDLTQAGLVSTTDGFAKLAALYINHYAEETFNGIAMGVKLNTYRDPAGRDLSILIQWELERLIDAGESLSIGEMRPVEGYTIRNAEGEEVPVNVQLLIGTIETVLRDLSVKGPFKLYADDEIIYIGPVYTVRNTVASVAPIAGEDRFDGVIGDFYADRETARFRTFSTGFSIGMGIVHQGRRMAIQRIEGRASEAGLDIEVSGRCNRIYFKDEVTG